MDRLQAAYIKIVTAGGDLNAAPELDLATDKVSIIVTPEVVEHIITRSPLPKERYEIGTNLAVKGVLASASLQEIQYLLGGSVVSEVYTKTQGVRTLPKYDIRVGVYRPSDGVVVPHDLTDMHFVAAVEMGFEQKKKSYLPFEAKGSDTSDFTIDNSVS
jgi:hypothetical protein